MEKLRILNDTFELPDKKTCQVVAHTPWLRLKHDLVKKVFQVNL